MTSFRSNEEREELLHRYHAAKTLKQGKRYLSIIHFKAGKPVAEIANLLFISEDTVRKWARRWDETMDVNDLPRRGRPSKLTEDQEDVLCEVVDENNPGAHGYDVAVWDCQELTRYVHSQWNVIMSAEALRKLLHRCGFTYQKVQYKFTKQDPEVREQYIQRICNLLETPFENTLILFEDEMSTKLHPKTGYAWSRNGPPKALTACSHKKLITMGAVAPTTGETLIAHYARNNTQSFITFLKQLEKRFRNKNIILCTDNYPVHHSKAVQKHLTTSNIQLLFQPSYSPDLNPIEQLWNYARKKWLNTKSPPNINSLRELLQQGFKQLTPELAQKICSTKYLTQRRGI